MAVIAKCTCAHEFQDKTYGKGNRVFNGCGDSSKPSEYRCTVCGRTVKSSEIRIIQQ